MAGERDRLWYKDAVIYEVRVRAFYDHDGDGIGDFRGLTEKLDYLQDLGVTALWLLPFYPSPLRDDGYDISDYLSVHPDVGTLADFKAFLRAAHERGLRVITELVLNHTSDRHVMFQQARRAPPGSALRDFYIWSDTPDRFRDVRIIFADFEHSNWAWDPVAHAYYYHRFYSHQPDLNFDNPRVHDFVHQVVDFWLEQGVDGLRLDAVPYLYKREGTSCENLPETHVFLRELRHHVDARFPGRMLLAEANQWSEDAVAYFGQGDESHMAFHFPIMPRMFMAVQMEDRFPLIEIVSQTPPIPDTCQWALFLRNHDELTLEMVTDEERDYMYRAYADDPQARVNLGIRRRLAPLMRSNRRRIELMNGLLLSLRGTPVLYYGDEIGMGDNIYLGDRNGVRTPMQWSADRNAGFSRTNPQRLYLPVIIDPEYHYETINVETQERNPSSLLHWTRRLLGLRRQHPAFGRGEIEFLYPDNPHVLAFLRRHAGEVVLVVANLSRFAQYVELDLATFAGMTPVELFGRTAFPRIGATPYLVTLGPHTFFWFALEAPRAGPRAAAPAPSLPTLAVRRRWDEVLGRKGRAILEGLLPGFLARCRWCDGTGRGPREAALVDVIAFGDPAATARLVLARVECAEGSAETCVVPLAFSAGEAAASIKERGPAALVAHVQGGTRAAPVDGLLHDALWDSRFPLAVLDALGRRRRIKGTSGELLATPRAALRQVRVTAADDLRPTLEREERGSTTVAYGDRLVVKLFRRLQEGVNPDVEVSRFLAERTAFDATPPVVGIVEYRQGRAALATVAIVRGFRPHHGDAWALAVEHARRFVERAAAQLPDLGVAPVPHGSLVDLCAVEPPTVVRDLMDDTLRAARLLGRRTADLHVALASPTDDPAFGVEPFTPLYRRALYQSMRNRARQALQLLRRRRRELDETTRAAADRVLAQEERLLGIYRTFLDAKVVAQRTRCHGRYRLQELLPTRSDFLVRDFEGDPARTLEARRTRRSPVRDVATLLRSVHFAALQPLADTEASGLAATDLPRRTHWAQVWRGWASAAFLAAYLEHAARGGFLPTDGAQLRSLVDAFMLEEAVYALEEELTQHPERCSVALDVVLQTASDGVRSEPPVPGRSRT
jgi:maltose alpha-D-glucosyltransferase/alpha-amylase